MLGSRKINFHGKNNEFICPSSAIQKSLKIQVYGNNNKIIIGENVSLSNTKILLGFVDCPVENCIVTVGANTRINSMTMQIAEDNSVVKIGEDCMLSYGVELYCTDTHAIFDENNNLLNRGESIHIGDHVWLCRETRIMKNTNIPSGCIVAQGAIVTKKFEKENSVIAGNPARIVKENIRWDKMRPNDFAKK